MDSVTRAVSGGLEKCFFQPYHVDNAEDFRAHIRAFRLDALPLNMQYGTAGDLTHLDLTSKMTYNYDLLLI